MNKFYPEPGDDEEEEVVSDSIATPYNDYASLIAVLNSGKSLEDWKKQIAAKKALLKKEAVEFVPRIDELKRSLPEPKDFAAIEKKIATLGEEIAKIDTLQADASKALAERQKGVLAKQRTLHQKQTDLSNIRYKIKSEIQQQQNEAGSKISSIQLQIREVSTLIQQMERQRDENKTNIAAYQRMIEEKNQVIARLRREWDEINREAFHFDDSNCQCPTCKQLLPAGDIEKQKADLQKNFNEGVARRKKSRVDESAQVKAEIRQLQDKIDHINSLGDPAVGIGFETNKVENLKFQLQKLQQAEAHKGVLNMDTAVDAMMKVNADALNLVDEINTLELQIKTETEALENSNGTDYSGRKQQLGDQVRELDRELSLRDAINHTNKRISELEMEERVNAQAIADIEQQEFDIESFTRAKMDILEDRVNSMFRYVKFRLFEKLVNGGIDETCVCEYKGVPYPTLNTAAKTLCGLDVINTFCKFYKVHAPIFCDNRESVTFIPECESQIISLFVSPSDKQLRIERVNSHQLELA
jgi:DNA repair protein SbcC/Rad50